MNAIEDIAAERRRHRTLGYTPAHDDGHAAGQLALAACCYATPDPLFVRERLPGGVSFTDPWPWGRETDERAVAYGSLVTRNSALGYARRRDLLVKAGSLIVAEIERLDRSAYRLDYTPPPTRPRAGPATVNTEKVFGGARGPNPDACKARQFSDQMLCLPCVLAWDVNDPDRPACRSLSERLRALLKVTR